MHTDASENRIIWYKNGFLFHSEQTVKLEKHSLNIVPFTAPEELTTSQGRTRELSEADQVLKDLRVAMGVTRLVAGREITKRSVSTCKVK